jgi:hypothetical protein
MERFSAVAPLTADIVATPAKAQYSRFVHAFVR